MSMRTIIVTLILTFTLLGVNVPPAEAIGKVASYRVYTNRSLVLDYYDGIDGIRVTERVPGGDYCKPCRIYRFYVPSGDDVQLRQTGKSKTYTSTGWHSFPSTWDVYTYTEIGRVN